MNRPTLTKPAKATVPGHSNATIEIGRIQIDISAFSDTDKPGETDEQRNAMVKRVTDAIYGILIVPAIAGF